MAQQELSPHCDGPGPLKGPKHAQNPRECPRDTGGTEPSLTLFIICKTLTASNTRQHPSRHETYFQAPWEMWGFTEKGRHVSSG